MARKKNPVTSLKKALDKSIDCLSANSEEITALLQQLAHTDMSQATDKDKAELKKLEEDILFLDGLIDKLIGD